MKYLSIDIETLGLDEQKHDIIEFGAVFDDFSDPQPLDKLPRFQACIYCPDDLYTGSAYAIAMNAEIIKKIAGKDKREEINKALKEGLQGVRKGTIQLDHMLTLDNLPGYFHHWLEDIEWPTQTQRFGIKEFKLNVAGKNFGGFDKKFLDAKQIKWVGIKWPHRFLDPAPLYFDPKQDKEVPSMKTCLERAGIPGEVQHNTIDDALMIVRLLRKKYL